MNREDARTAVAVGLAIVGAVIWQVGGQLWGVLPMLAGGALALWSGTQRNAR